MMLLINLCAKLPHPRSDVQFFTRVMPVFRKIPIWEYFGDWDFVVGMLSEHKHLPLAPHVTGNERWGPSAGVSLLTRERTLAGHGARRLSHCTGPGSHSGRPSLLHGLSWPS